MIVHSHIMKLRKIRWVRYVALKGNRKLHKYGIFRRIILKEI